MKSILKDLPQTPLTPEKEQELLAAGDKETIVLHALLPATRYVNRTSRFQVIAETLSLCYVALSKAVKNFRPNKGKFISYAIPYLRGAVCAEWRKKDVVRNASKHETPLEKDAYPPRLTSDSVEPDWGSIHWREIWAQVEPVIRTLKPIEIRVLEYRYKFSMTLEETGEQIGRTRARVKQIETEAMEKLRGALSSGLRL